MVTAPAEALRSWPLIHFRPVLAFEPKCDPMSETPPSHERRVLEQVLLAFGVKTRQADDCAT